MADARVEIAGSNRDLLDEGEPSLALAGYELAYGNTYTHVAGIGILERLRGKARNGSAKFGKRQEVSDTNWTVLVSQVIHKDKVIRLDQDPVVAPVGDTDVEDNVFRVIRAIAGKISKHIFIVEEAVQARSLGRKIVRRLAFLL